MRATLPMHAISARLIAFLRDRRGVAAIEMAIIAPVLLLLYFGTVDTANWYMAHRRLILAGSTIADLTTQSATSVKSTDIDDYWEATGAIVDPAAVSGYTVRDYRVNGTTSRMKWKYTPAGMTSCGTDSTDAELQAIKDDEMTDGNDILVVKVCSTIPAIVLHVFIPDLDQLELEYKMAMRPRLSKTLDCTSGCTVY